MSKSIFIKILASQYTELFQLPQYARAASKSTPQAFAEKMTEAILNREASIIGDGVLNTARILGIGKTQKALEAFINAPELAPGKTKFVVVDENVLGYIYPQTPDRVEILSSSIIRGATVTWKDGNIATPTIGMRRATMADFKTFRVNPKGYLEDETNDLEN